jgi:hypothetical protein
VSFTLLLPVAELAVWSAVVLLPTLFMYTRLDAVQRSGDATVRSGQIELTQPPDHWLAWSLTAVGERRFHLITDLNLPGLLVGAPLSLPAAAYLRQHPTALSMRTWHTITIPFFCLPAWWFVGLGLDSLLARRRLRMAPIAIGAALSCACMALLIGILTSPPTDRPDLVGFLPGAVFWAVAFAVFPLNWFLRRRHAAKEME